MFNEFSVVVQTAADAEAEPRYSMLLSMMTKLEEVALKMTRGIEALAAITQSAPL